MDNKPTKIEQISADELNHQQYLLKQRENAEISLDSWGRYIAQKYKLNMNDAITPEGMIIRNAANNDDGKSV